MSKNKSEKKQPSQKAKRVMTLVYISVFMNLFFIALLILSGVGYAIFRYNGATKSEAVHEVVNVAENIVAADPEPVVQKPEPAKTEKAEKPESAAGEENPFADMTQEEKVEYIHSHQKDYPAWLLTSFEKNYDLCDFVLAYPTTGHRVTGGLTDEELAQTDPVFCQWDARWGYFDYGDNILGVTGCGPAVVSMALYSLLGDETLTPDEIARYAMDNGLYSYGTGTTWKLITKAPQEYGLVVTDVSRHNEAQYKEVLDAGGKLILSMGKGEFATQGHFIEIVGYTDEGFIVNDPFYTFHNDGTAFPFEIFSSQSKHVWGYTTQENPVFYSLTPVNTPVEQPSVEEPIIIQVPTDDGYEYVNQ